ncbi:hypothetical protein ACP4OV_011169 [Aristida adscensionis]
MAVTVARVHLAVAHAALPPLLPTPPKSMMLPLLPTPPCVVATLPAVSPPKISRADSDERWDARKNAATPLAKPGRADSGERWDAHKNKPGISPAPYDGGKASQDGKKTTIATSSSSSRGICSSSTGASATSQTWVSNKRPVTVSVRRASSSAARWDVHKKPRSLQAAVVLVDDGESSSGSNDVELEGEPPQRAFYAGQGFVAAPEPTMLPMPAFLVRVA